MFRFALLAALVAVAVALPAGPPAPYHPEVRSLVQYYEPIFVWSESDEILRGLFHKIAPQ